MVLPMLRMEVKILNGLPLYLFAHLLQAIMKHGLKTLINPCLTRFDLQIQGFIGTSPFFFFLNIYTLLTVHRI